MGDRGADPNRPKVTRRGAKVTGPYACQDPASAHELCANVHLVRAGRTSCSVSRSNWRTLRTSANILRVKMDTIDTALSHVCAQPSGNTAGSPRSASPAHNASCRSPSRTTTSHHRPSTLPTTGCSSRPSRMAGNRCRFTNAGGPDGGGRLGAGVPSSRRSRIRISRCSRLVRAPT